MLYVYSEEQKLSEGSIYVNTEECWIEVTDIIKEIDLNDFRYCDVEVLFQSDKVYDTSEEFPSGEKVGIPMDEGIFIIQTNGEPPEKLFDELRKLRGVPSPMLPLIIPQLIEDTLGKELKKIKRKETQEIKTEVNTARSPIKTKNIEQAEMIDLPLDNVVSQHKQRMKDLIAKIDEALDNGDEELFIKLSKEYQYLKAEC